MSGGLFWDNLVAYCLQIAVLVGIAAALPWLLRMRAAWARLLFWQLTLVASLALPLVQRWRQAVVVVTAETPLVPLRMAPLPRAAHSWTIVEIALACLAAGIGVRLVWLCLGMLRLRRYRRDATELAPLQSGISGLVQALAPRTRLCVSRHVSGPVTFGVIRPVVLLPAAWSGLQPEAQRAIICHELLHVARQDWLFTMAEELVRALFWFHPAIWWLLARIQLSREETVDHRVLGMAATANDYVDALLLVAGAKPQPDLALAPLFLRRRQLKQRVISLVEDLPMSKRRLLSVLATGIAGVAAACWLAVTTFPLQASPQLVADADGVAVDTGDATFVHRTGVDYPEAARRKGVQGTVSLEVSIAADGTVSDARVVSGPEELRNATLQSVLQWHFTRASGAGTRMVNVAFRLPAAATGTSSGERNHTPAPAAEPVGPGMTLAYEFRGLSPTAESELRARLRPREGAAVDRAAVQQLQTETLEYDRHLVTRVNVDRESKRITLQISAPETVQNAAAENAPPLPPPTPGVQRIRIGGNKQDSKVVNKPRPVYPPAAKQARVQGVVKLQVLIDKEGNVSNIGVISGDSLLVQSAVDAVRQWQYAPTWLNGNPVEVLTQVDVNYTLLQ